MASKELFSVANIDLSAIEGNVEYLKSKVNSETFFCPMVKANAYGHGSVEVSRLLQDMKVHALGVISVEEALEIRKGGVDLPILVFGRYTAQVAEEFLSHDLIPVIANFNDVQQFQGYRGPVHLKFNTGMNRLGLSPQLEKHEWNLLKSLNVQGVCTHFLKASDAQDSKGYTQAQLEVFSSVLSEFKNVIVHTNNTEAILRGAAPQFGSRPGLGIYGLAPSNNCTNLSPAMSWSSKILQIQRLRAGDTVSYDALFSADKDMNIGIVSMGYADGYSRSMVGKAKALVSGSFCDVLGAICMDYLAIDLSNQASVKVGDWACLLGAQGENCLSAHDLAAWQGTICYEVVSRVGNRLTRMYTHK